MQLTCPACTTSYAAAPGALGETGRKVKCHKCAHVWFATPDQLAEPDIAASPPPAQEEPAGDSASVAQEPIDDLDFEDLEDAPGEEDESMLTSADAEADAAWESVLADVGLQQPGGDLDDDVDVLDMLDDPDRVRRHAVPAPGVGEDIESLAARRLGGEEVGGLDGAFAARTPRRRAMRRLALAAGLALMLAGAAAAALIARQTMVAVLPGTATLYAAVGYPVNLRGIEFQNVTFEKGVENGLPVLAIRGEVVNLTEKPLLVPEIRFALRNEAKVELFHWMGRAASHELAPAGRAEFLTRLQAPPATAAQLQVRFVGRAGGRT